MVAGRYIKTRGGRTGGQWQAADKSERAQKRAEGGDSHVDELIKLPISERWHDGNRFHVRVAEGELSVEPIRPLAAAV